MKSILWAFDKLHRLYEGLVILILSAMIISVFSNVFARYVLNSSLGWVDELARFLFIWLVFLAAVLAYEKAEHIGLDFFVQYVPEKYRKYVILFAEILVLVALGFITVYGYRVAMAARNISPGLEIRMTYVYIVVPIGAFLMSCISVKRIIEQFQAIAVPSRPDTGKKVGL